MRGSLHAQEFCAVIEPQRFTYFKRYFSLSELMRLAADRPPAVPSGRAAGGTGSGRSASPRCVRAHLRARLRGSAALRGEHHPPKGFPKGIKAGEGKIPTCR